MSDSPTDPEGVDNLLMDALDLPASDRERFLRNVCDDQRVLDAVFRKLRIAEQLESDFLRPPSRGDDAPGITQLWAEELVRASEAREFPDLTGQRIAERYELLEQIGYGSFGVVYRALDWTTTREAAVKLVWRTRDERSSVRDTELAALLFLDTPGVLRLLGHGRHLDKRFYVTPLIHGGPFPGYATPVEWTVIAGTVASLLDTLRRVHGAGIVHADIKPSNVLVDERGFPTLLDLGVAAGPALSSEIGAAQIGGTRVYAAPERLEREHREATPASDVYAVGVLIYEALTGAPPHASLSPEELVRARKTTPADRGPLDRAGVAPEVSDVIERLLAVDPRDRPTAAEATALLRNGHAEPVLSTLPLPAGGVHTLDELASIFAGPDRIFHLAEDAAALLFERTGGVSANLPGELTEWIRVGAATEKDGRLQIDRRGIELVRRVRAGDVFLAPELTAVAASGNPGELVDLACRLARDASSRGHTERAESVLCAALNVVHSHETAETLAGRLLTTLIGIVLAPGSERGIELALYECERAHVPGANRSAHWLIADAALRAARGDSRRALAQMESMPTCTDLDLEHARRSVMTFAARRLGPAISRRLVEDSVRWVTSHAGGGQQQAALEWEGWQCYLEHDFERAAELHWRAAELSKTTMARASALLNAASAYLEAFDLDRALTLAQTAAELARTGRHANFEARAERIARAARYRAGTPITVDRSLAEAVTLLRSPSTEAQLLLGEAAIAWRSGDQEIDQETTVEFASEASARWTGLRFTTGALLADALARTAGAEFAPEHFAAALDPGAPLRPPGGHLQLLGLYGYVEGGVSPDLQQLAQRLAAQIPEAHHGYRREVLSVTESLAYCGYPPNAPPISSETTT